MTAVDVSGLRDLAEAATPGRWEVVCDGYGDTSLGTGREHRRDLFWVRVRHEVGSQIVNTYGAWTESTEDDVLFIAAFGPETALRLLGVATAVERLCDEVEAEGRALAPFDDDWGDSMADTVRGDALLDTAKKFRDALTALR